MKIEFDHAVNVLYIQLTEGEIEYKINLENDANGSVLGVEVLYASKRGDLSVKIAV